MSYTTMEVNMACEHAETILEILAEKGECELDALALACPRLGWHQIFHEVDRLSREGRVRLRAKGRGIYVISLAGDDRGGVYQLATNP